MAWPAAAQVRDAAGGATGTARLGGTVTAAGTGQPLPGATVRITGAAVERSTRTDTLGQFAFNDLPAGQFTLSAGRSGFLDVIHGQAQPGSGRPGTPIALADGQQRLDLEVAMPRGGAITGLVVDEFGYPAVETEVRAYRYAYRAGTRQLVQAGAGRTDDRGLYRVFGLEPGDYVVAATPRNEAGMVAERMARVAVELDMVRQELQMVQLRGTPEERATAAARMASVEREAATRTAAAAPAPTSGYAPVYYPGTTRSASAATVPVGVSTEAAGIDLALATVPLATVQGSVSGLSPLPRSVRIFLTEVDGLPGIGSRSTRAMADGSFSFSGVPPGQYRLSAQVSVEHVEVVRPADGSRAREVQTAPPDRFWARQDITVTGQSVMMPVTLLPGMTASGRIDFAGAATRPEDLTTIRINFLPTDLSASEAEMEMGSAVGRVLEDGTFVATGLMPGRYRVTAARVDSPWRLQSVLAGGREVLDLMLDVEPGADVPPLAVTLGDRSSSLSGTLQLGAGTPTAGYTIIVFPEDRRFWLPHARRIQATRPSSDGQFSLSGLPAGDYRLAAVVDPEPDIWFDPDFLGQLLAASIAVTLGEGEDRVQDVRIGGR